MTRTPRNRMIQAGAGLAACCVILLTTVSGATATTPHYATTTGAVPAAAGWLATQFADASHLPAPDGDHFDNKYGKDYIPNYGENADVLFGLAAAHGSRAAINTALHYLAENIDAYADISDKDGYGPSDGSIAKAAVAAIVAGRTPTSFGGVNLMKTLQTGECTPTATTCVAGQAANIYASISESFVILAEARAGGSYAPSTNALSYFDSLQCASGGFTDGTAACGSGAADVDSTSYAIMALQAAGDHSAELTKAVHWLTSQRKHDEYWVSQGAANTDSTALAVAALAGQHVDVSGPRSWLRRQQVPAGRPGAGALKYLGGFTATTTAATSPSVLATAQGLAGLVGGGSLATLTAGTGAANTTLFAPATTLSGHSVRAGHAQRATGSGFVAGERARAVIHSAAITLGTARVAPDGTVTIRYTVPRSLSAGTHHVVIVGLTSGLSASRTVTVTVVARHAPASSTPPSSASTPPSAAPTSAGSTTTTAPVAPSSTGPTLAATGQNRQQLDRLALLGGLALLAGAALLLLGRRRAH